ncbi:MAG: S46 family peptidase [Bacteroidales bacterium]|nr:S46 family peptidase [Bacteroidales bacterium]
MKKLLFSLTLLALLLNVRADEGMWLPMFLKYNESEMQKMGFHLTAEDVYSVNHHSMKDAIMLFGGGCTGELISPDGLVLTNHHCGYSYIQQHSSLEHNYLHNGFWAKSYDEELPNPGLKVTFLVRMEDVTDEILVGISDTMSEKNRNQLISEHIAAVISTNTAGTHYEAVVKPFFYGNQYFLFVNETFTDVRLVGTPPESIGKFGGDTDNWMWPRHTGDFSLFRIYTDKNGNPAPYSESNIPMKSKRYFTISSKGINENDFTLVFGYPGRTQQFLLSDAVDIVANIQNPIAIQARTIRLNAMKYWMDQSVETRLMYSAKANSISNGWKKWQGESKGINECNVLEKKQLQEMDFKRWVEEDEVRMNDYGTLLPSMKRLYKSYGAHMQVYMYDSEVFMGVEILSFILKNVFPVIVSARDAKMKPDDFEKQKAKLLASATSFFKSYNSNIDNECFVNLLHYYFSSQDPQAIPDALKKYINVSDVQLIKMGGTLGEKSPYYTDSEKFVQWIQEAEAKDFVKLENSEIIKMLDAIATQLQQVLLDLGSESNQINAYYRTYVRALMEKENDKTFYPDANLTMRVTYGQVKGFEPMDGKEYVYYTTLDGIMDKENPDVFDYKVDAKLKELYQNKNYGRYANAKGELPVAFIASNHTTGGNSGSPVINADGELIGVNFDRVWEGTMSDINYDASRCRNISLDIRYFLFIVDKFANAQNIMNELTVN